MMIRPADRRTSAARTEVAVVTTVHDRGDQRIYGRQIKTLAEAGWTVHYLACGRPRRMIAGVAEHDLGGGGSRVRRLTATQLKAFRELWRLQSCRIVHAHDPELIPMLVVLRALGWRVIFDLHEDVPAQLLTKPWLHPRSRRLMARVADVVERLLPRLVDVVIVAEPVVAARLSHRGCVVVVQNFVDLEEAAVGPVPNRSARWRLVYLGSVSRDRGLHTMIGLVRALVDGGHDVQLDVLGPVQDATPADLASLTSGLPVSMHGYTEREAAWDVLARADVGLALLRPIPNYIDAQPTKVFEYMAAGLPCLVSDFPRCRAIFEGYPSVMLVDPEDIDAAARVIVELLTDADRLRELRSTARAAAEDFSWSTQAEKLLRVYEAVVHDTARG